MSNVLLCRQLTKSYFQGDIETTVLSGLELTVEKGELLAIVGSSGCGKSTFLNILANLDDDFKGHIEMPFENISFMFQDDRLLPWLSIKENLLLVSKKKDLNEIKRVLKLIGLENILDEFPKSLSGGMKRRIALSRAFINKPQLILLDEPFTSLDFPTSQELKYEFIKLCKEFKPLVILVIHDLSEAILFSNRIFFLSKNNS